MTSASPSDQPSGSALSPGMLSAIRVYGRTLGYVLPAWMHILVLSLITFALTVGAFAVSAMAFLFLHRYVGIAISLVTFLPFALLWLPYADRRMFGILAGQVAVTTALIARGERPQYGEGLFKGGRAVVAQTFGEVELFHAFHARLDSMFGHLFHTIDHLDNKNATLSTVKKYVRIIQSLVVRHLEWLVISYALTKEARGEEALERASVEATCHIMQNGIGLLGTAVFIAILERIVESVSWFLWSVGLFAGIFLYCYLVAYELPIPDFSTLTLASAIPILTDLGFLFSVMAALLVAPLLGYVATWALLTGIVRPIATTMMLLKFHSLIRRKPLEPEWEARIREGEYTLDRLDWLSFQAFGVGH